MMIDDLSFLLKELGCKTPPGEILSDQKEMLIAFLKMEIEYRRQDKIKKLLRMSGIKHVKTLEQFDWHFNPKISKDDILTFVHSPWIENASNLVLIGDTGLGKSHIAAGICYEALLRGYPTACITAFDLVSKIHKAYNPSSKIDYYAKVRVLCID
jgi:DNA replication protein DnaC